MSSVTELEAYLRSTPEGWWAVLCRAIPELEKLEGTSQPKEYHAEGDVAKHTRMAVEECPEGCDPDLLWAALLHDIGKPATTRQLDSGRIVAHGHAEHGERMTLDILKRLGMPLHRAARIAWAVRHHGFHHSWQLESIEDATPRQLRFLNEPDFPLVLQLLKVDCLASHSECDLMTTYNLYQALYDHHRPD